MSGVTLNDRKTAEWIREQTGTTNIVIDTSRKEWRRAGQVMRTDNG